jgi:WD40 repeat protein
MVLTGSDDHTARLWDVQTGQEVRQFVGHTDQVWSVTFSPDGRYVLTGSYDLTARLWDISTGQVVRQFVGHMSALRSLAFSADGRRVLIGDFTAAYLWRTELAETVAFACAQLPRDFTTDERIFYSITTDESICAEHGAEVRPITPAGTPLSTAAGSG